MSTYSALRPILEPRSVAIVGVSRRGKQGAVFLNGLKDPGFDGPIYVVNPSADEVLGVKAYPTVADLPETPDLAVLTLPAEPAIRVVSECAAQGVPGAALFTAGFHELGTAEGRERGERLLAAAGGRTRLIGPNGMGVYNPRRGVAMFPGLPSQAGGLGLVSQSGSLTSFTVRAAASRGIGFSKAIAMGNQLDLNAADYFEFLADDPETAMIGAYIEGVPDGPAFRRALERAAATKPVIIWKAGRVAGGAKAAQSHTGQLAGSYAVWRGMARQTGAVLVREMDELLDILALVAALGSVDKTARRIAVVTGPGGPAVSASDTCEEVGLTLAKLSDPTSEALRERVATAGTSVRNPVDVGMVIAGATEVFAGVLGPTMADPGVDAAVVIGGEGGRAEAFARMLVDVRKATGKPLMYAASGDFSAAETARLLTQGGVAVVPSAERALRAYARLIDR